MKNFKVHLNISGKFDCPDVIIENVESVEIVLVGKFQTGILINGKIMVDFGNEVFGITELP